MKRAVRITLLLLTIAIIGAGLYLYNAFLAKVAVPEGLDNYTVKIPTHSTFEEVVALLKAQDFVQDEQVFRVLADRMAYERDPMRPGRFEVQPGWNHIELIRHLRNGPQAPVNVVLHNERLIEEVAGKVAGFLEQDSLAFLTLMQNEGYLDSIGYTPETLMSLFIPNTYEFYWNTEPEAFMGRMIKEHDRFWKQHDRQAKANKKAMTPAEKANYETFKNKKWTFDDGKELGSYNTQQHWLTHDDGLFLVYTRRGAGNDHVMRHRAPLFIAQVDPLRLRVIRATERVLIPERGATLGNFGAAPIN